MSATLGALVLLALLEILGRILYPLTREARAAREATRDHRVGLSYLGGDLGAYTVLRDIYLLEKRYLPFLGWLGAPNIRLATIETNAMGFRDGAVQARAEGEYRVLITGGSFAWGLGASSNAMTVAGRLEELLNRRDPAIRYRVTNGAFMNWTSRHEYVVVTEFFDAFDPDLVVSLSGYNDLVTLSKGIEIDALPEARLLAQAVADHLQPLGTLRALRKLAGTLGLWRLVVLLRGTVTARSLAHQYYRYEPQEGPRQVVRTAERYLSIAEYLARRKRRYLLALEPEIYSSRKPLTVEEFDLKSYFIQLDHGLLATLTRYRRDLKAKLEKLAEGRFQLLDLADIFDQETRPVFIDYNHVCDLGNELVAEVLAKAISGPAAR